MRRSLVDDVGSALTAEWDELADQVGASPFLRPGWFRAWADSFRDGRLAVLTTRRHGALTGVLPLVRSGTAWSSPTNWHTAWFGPVVAEPDDAAALAAGIVAGNAHRADLRFLDPRNPATAALCSAFGPGHRTTQEAMDPAPYVDTGGSWDGYLAGLDGKFVKDLHRQRRRLHEHGEVAVDVLDGTQALDAALDEGFAIEAAGWKGQQGTAIVAQPATARFYRAMARWAAERGWLRLAFLRVGGRAIAFDFGLEAGATHFGLKTGYDATYRRFSPGNVLRWGIVRRAFEEGATSYELLGRPEPWKARWTTHSRPRVRIHAFRSTPRGLVSWAAWSYGRPAAKRLQATVRASR